MSLFGNSSISPLRFTFPLLRPSTAVTHHMNHQPRTHHPASVLGSAPAPAVEFAVVTAPAPTPAPAPVVVTVLVVVAPVVAVVVPAHGCTNALPPAFHVLSLNPHVSLSLGMSGARDHNETKRTQRVVRCIERKLQATKNTRTFTSGKLVSSSSHETCESRGRITKLRITTLILQLWFVQAP